MESLGLIEPTSDRREVFRVTHSGYEAVEQIEMATFESVEADG